MRVVLDTNTFVAAGFNPKSSSARIIRASEDGVIELMWNEATRGETKRMIERIPGLSWERFAGLFRPENEHKGPIDLDGYDFIEDPDDRKFAALAQATDSIIVTNDRDLLTPKARLRVRVLTPREFAEELGLPKLDTPAGTAL